MSDSNSHIPNTAEMASVAAAILGAKVRKAKAKAATKEATCESECSIPDTSARDGTVAATSASDLGNETAFTTKRSPQLAQPFATTVPPFGNLSPNEVKSNTQKPLTKEALMGKDLVDQDEGSSISLSTSSSRTLSGDEAPAESFHSDSRVDSVVSPSRKETSTSQSEPLPKSALDEMDEWLDLVHLLELGICPAPKPVKDIIYPDCSPREKQEVLENWIQPSLAKLSRRVRTLHSALFTISGLPDDLEISFPRGQREIQGLPEIVRLSRHNGPRALSADQADEFGVILTSFYDEEDIPKLLEGNTLFDLEQKSHSDSRRDRIEFFDAVMRIAVPVTQYTLLAFILEYCLRCKMGAASWTEESKAKCVALFSQIKALCSVWEEFTGTVTGDGEARKRETWEEFPGNNEGRKREIFYWGWMTIQGAMRRQLHPIIQDLIHPWASDFLLSGPLPLNGPVHGMIWTVPMEFAG